MSPGLMISFTISSMQLWKCFKRHSVTIQCYNYVFFSINIHTSAMYYKNVSHQYYAIIQDRKPHVVSQNCPKQGRSISSFICHSLFYYTAFFLLKGKLKDITIHVPNEIINDIISCYQFSHQILTLLSLMLTDITQFYWINGTQLSESMNPIQKMSTDFSRI